MKFENRNIEKAHFLMILSNIRKQIAGDEVCTSSYEEIGNLKILIDSIGANLLHYSAQTGDNICTDWLLNHGLDVNSKTNNGDTPLMLAAAGSHEETVRVLLKAGAKIDLFDNDGQSVLQKLSYQMTDRSSIPGALLMKLMDKCVTVEEAAVKLYNAKCPLNVVVLLKNRKITEYFLKQRLDDTRENQDGPPALHVAVHFEDLEGVELLLDYGYDVNCKDSYGRVALMYMGKVNYCQNMQLNILKILLDRGIELTTTIDTDKIVCMQIHSLFYYGTTEAISLVLKSNINMRAKDDFGKFPLHYLVFNQKFDNYQLLQNLNLEVDARTGDGSTALHFASRLCQVNVVRYLIRRGADINTKNSWSWRPLFEAVARHSRTYKPSQAEAIECVEVLLQSGADAQLPLGTQTIFEVAFENNGNFLIETILAHFAILEATGTEIKPEINQRIESDSRLTKPYHNFKQLIEKLQKTVIFEELKLFELLIASEEKLLLYLRNQQVVSNLETFNYQDYQDAYYYKKLQKRIRGALKKLQLKRRAAVVLCEIMQVCYDSYPSIIDEIFGYLSEEDIVNLSKIQEVYGDVNEKYFEERNTSVIL